MERADRVNWLRRIRDNSCPDAIVKNWRVLCPECRKEVHPHHTAESDNPNRRDAFYLCHDCMALSVIRGVRKITEEIRIIF